jgi:hypothetical protein
VTMTIRMKTERLQRTAWIYVGAAVLWLSLVAAPTFAAKYTKISWDLHTSYASTFDGPNLSGPILGGTAVFTPAAGTFSTPSTGASYAIFPGTLVFHLWGAAGDLTITNTPDCGVFGDGGLSVYHNGAVFFNGNLAGCSLRSGGVTYAFPLVFGPRKTIHFRAYPYSYTYYRPIPVPTQMGRVTVKTHNCEGGPPCPTITTLLHHDFYLGNEVRVSATTEVPALSDPAQIVLGLVLITGCCAATTRGFRRLGLRAFKGFGLRRAKR